ncbi:MAG: cell wall hydrolase [Clostridia bacterium]|nr:cell wall hydrolase [Clostridia bacterium]
MLSEAQRRKAASLSVALAIFIPFTKICQAVDTVPDEVTSNVVTQGNESVSSSESTYTLLQELELKTGLSSNKTFEEMEMVKCFPNYQIPEMVTVSNNVNPEEMLKFWENEVAESAEKEEVGKFKKKQLIYRSVTITEPVEEKVSENVTTLANSVEQNVEERGTIFFYVEPTDHTEEDVKFLAWGIHGEAGNQEVLEKWRVGNTMVNRKEDDTGRFPQNSVKGILYASGQFGCIHGSSWGYATEEEYEIARELLEGKRVFPADIVWFNNTWDYGFFYCKPGYHCFSGYLDHNGDSLLASAKVTANAKQTETEVEVVDEVVQEEVDLATMEQVDNSENIEEIEGIVENSSEEVLPDTPEQQEEPLEE